MHDAASINAMFVTCCIIHNMILMGDDGHRLWEDDVNWDELDPPSLDEERIEAHNQFASLVTVAMVELTEDPATFDEFTPQIVPDDGMLTRIDDLIATEHVHHSNEVRQHFELLRDLLANHLHFIYRARKLRWPKSRASIESYHNNIVRQHFPSARDLREQEVNDDGHDDCIAIATA